MTSNNDIDAQIKHIFTSIIHAQLSIHNGEIIDIKPFEKAIETLCLDLKDMLPKDAKTFRDDLEKLFSQMESLERDFNMQHDALQERLGPKEDAVNPLFAQEIFEESKLESEKSQQNDATLSDAQNDMKEE